MLDMNMNINRQDKYLILIKFKIKIQFVMFMRGHLWTPIDPAPVLLSGKPCSTSHVGTGGKPSTWFPPGDS